VRRAEADSIVEQVEHRIFVPRWAGPAVVALRTAGLSAHDPLMGFIRLESLLNSSRRYAEDESRGVEDQRDCASPSSTAASREIGPPMLVVLP
jgi:hypothetical protein